MSKVTTITWGARTFAVPKGFEAVLPEDFRDGEDVYIVGTLNSRAHAYGPFEVYDAGERELKNKKLGRIFTEPTSHWLRKIS